VWYRWTAPKSGSVVVDTCDTNFDTLLSAYTGGSVGTLERVADNNNHADCGGGWGSKMTFEAEAGTVYNIAVSGAGGARAGIFTLEARFTPDDVPPETTLEASGPTGTVNTRSASFDFDSNEAGGFLCSLDGEPFTDCGDSPKVYSDLADGEHTFRVKAVDRAGNEDATPATRTWIVDATAPQTNIASGPSGFTRSKTASFAFSSDEANATFECSLDGASFAPCSSPESYSNLSDGSHAFRVKATDAAGNVDESPATRSFTVDTVAPRGSIKINNGAATTRSLSVRLTLSASDSGSGVSQMCVSNTTRCTAWQPFARSKAWRLAGNKAGTKTVYVRFKDRAGNVSTLYRDTIRYAPRR
jgi:large repetitive protein